MRLIDADKLKAHYSWWKGGSREMTMDEAKNDFDTIIDLQPTVEAEPKRGICEDCLFLDSHDDFAFACKKGKEIHDLNGTCDKWRSAYLRGEAEPTKHGRWIYEGHTGEPSEPFFSCSACQYVHYKASNYCPNCGAKMDEVEE